MVEVPVLDAFLVELHGKAGEGLQHGQGPRCGEACGGLRQRGVVGAPRDVVAVAEQSAGGGIRSMRRVRANRRPAPGARTACSYERRALLRRKKV